MPSRMPEPYGLVAAEALMSGIPVVVSSNALIAEEVERNEAGLVFQSGDARSLADKLSSTDDDALMERLSSGALAYGRRIAPSRARMGPADGGHLHWQKRLFFPLKEGSMARALVTGGVVSSDGILSRRLLIEGLDVTCVDLLVPGTRGATPRSLESFPGGRFAFSEEDCRSFLPGRRSISITRFHLAALVGGQGRHWRQERSMWPRTLLSTPSSGSGRQPAKPGCIGRFSVPAPPILSSLQTVANQRLLSEDMISFEGLMGLPDLAAMAGPSSPANI